MNFLNKLFGIKKIIANMATDKLINLKAGTGVILTPNEDGTEVTISAPAQNQYYPSVTNVIAQNSVSPVSSKAIYNALQNKQDNLTPGEGISIEGNVISVTGGSSGGSSSSTPITVDTTLNASSQNPIANSAVTNAINSISSSGTVVDDELSSSSSNPVKNSVIKEALDGKQSTLVSGTNIKTINNQSILGSGNITISTSSAGSAGSGTAYDGSTQKVYLTNPSDGILTQAMLDVIPPNGVIVVGYDYTISSNITIPANSMLCFEGGSITGSYTIDGNGSSINENVSYNIFGTSTPVNFRFSYFDLRWIGGVPDFKENGDSNPNLTGVTDNSPILQRAIDILGMYYPGLPIRIIGQYWFNSGVSTIYDVNIEGSHRPYRLRPHGNTSSNVWNEPSSPSLMAIGNGSTDFSLITLNGRPWVNNNAEYTIAHFNIRNIKVIGYGTDDAWSEKCNFIEYQAHGVPTRISSIVDCEFVGMKWVLYGNVDFSKGHASATASTIQDTSLGNLSIVRCLGYHCKKFIYSISTGYRSGQAGHVFNNLVVKDSNIEHCGTYCFDIGYSYGSGGAFGSLIFENNNLEGQTTPIVVYMSRGSVFIRGNYFEGGSSTPTTITDVAKIRGDSESGYCFIEGNYYRYTNTAVDPAKSVFTMPYTVTGFGSNVVKNDVCTIR